MIRCDAIPQLIALLKRRQASLFHAVQLRDFHNYLELGGIPSRACQHAHGGPYTRLVTDANDQANGVWDKVFVNLADFGREFAQGGTWVPNPFGPIALQLRPEALLEADDVAVCLRSAGAAGFCREREALTSVAAVDALFAYPAGSGFDYSVRLKTRHLLDEARPGASHPEVSLTIASGRLGLGHTLKIWVDPYTFNGCPLVEHVQALVAGSAYPVRVLERSCQSARRLLYDELATLIRAGNPSLPRWVDRPELSPALRVWGKEVLKAGLGYQYERFARYLLEGTLDLLANQPAPRPCVGITRVFDERSVR